MNKKMSLLAAAAAFVVARTDAQIYDSNLLINGDAEMSPAATVTGQVTPTFGWTVTSNFTAVEYGVGGFPTLADPGPANRGTNFFTGGPGNTLSTATQSLSLLDYSAAIASGTLEFSLSGYLGGFSSQDDNATFSATFFDAASNVLSLASLGPVTRADRGSGSGLLFRSTSGFIPVAATLVQFTMTMDRFDGSYNDGYADNLSFSIASPSTEPPISAVPEPSTYGLIGAAAILGVVVLRSRSRKSATVALA